MNVGDLVVINQRIPEFVDEKGQQTGVIIGDHDPRTSPQLFEVMWASGETESLYEDELDAIGHASETR